MYSYIQRKILSLFMRNALSGLLKYLFFVFLLILICSSTGLSEAYRTIHYDVTKGLNSDLIKSISQDEIGFIWIGTDDGLICYDGVNFTTYNQDLPSLFVKSVTQNTSFGLLAVTDNGIVKVTSYSDTAFIKTIIPGTKARTDSLLRYPKDIFEFPVGTLWISETDAIVKYKDGNLQRYDFTAKDRSFSFIRSFKFFDDGYSNVYTVSQTGNIYIYDRKEESFVEVHLPVNIANVGDALKVSKGIVWICHSNGILEIELNRKGKIINYTNFADGLDVSAVVKTGVNDYYCSTWSTGIYKIQATNKHKTISHLDKVSARKINDIYLDRDSNIWISTDTGVFLYRETEFVTLYEENLLFYVNDILPYEKGRVLVSNDKGIYEINKKSDDYDYKLIFHPDKCVPLRLGYHDGLIWYTDSYGSVNCLSRTKSKIIKTYQITPDIPIFCMEVDHAGNIWVADAELDKLCRISQDGKLNEYNLEKYNLENIEVVGVSTDGTVYCGSDNIESYLYKYNEVSDTFEDISIPIHVKDQTNEFLVNDIVANNDGVWLATTIGLYFNDGTTCERIDPEDFNSDNIGAVIVDKANRVWFSVKNGLYVKNGSQFTLFNEADGLSNKTIGDRSLEIDENGQLWVGTSLGISIFSGEYQLKPTPEPILRNIVLDNKKIKLDNFKELKIYRDEVLQLDYISLVYPGENVLYQYRISSYDNDWSIPAKNNSLIVPKVSYGKHKLEIRAHQRGSYDWSTPEVLDIKVRKRFYYSWWSAALMTFFSIIIIHFLVQRRTIRLQKEKEELEKLVKERTDEVIEQYEKTRDMELETQQMRTANKIAATIAHEFNNPLAIIRGISELIQSQGFPEEDRLEQIKKIPVQVDRMHSLVEKLLRLRNLKEMDYAAGMKILDIHNHRNEAKAEENSHKDEKDDKSESGEVSKNTGVN